MQQLRRLGRGEAGDWLVVAGDLCRPKSITHDTVTELAVVTLPPAECDSGGSEAAGMITSGGDADIFARPRNENREHRRSSVTDAELAALIVSPAVHRSVSC